MAQLVTSVIAVLCALSTVQGACQHGGTSYPTGATWTYMAGTPMHQSCSCPGSGVASCTLSLNLGLAATSQPRCYDADAVDQSSLGFFDPGRNWVRYKEEGLYTCCCPYEFYYDMDYHCVPYGTSVESCYPTTSTTTTTVTSTTTTDPPTTTTTATPTCVDPYEKKDVYVSGDQWPFKEKGGVGGVCQCMVYLGILQPVCVDYGWEKGKRENWKKADEKCDKDKKGKRLAIVDSAEKIAALQLWVAKYGERHDYWLGASDEKNEGSWVWDNGNSVTDNDWFPGAFPAAATPDGGNKQDCLLLTDELDKKYKLPRRMWDDEDCKKREEGLCEYQSSVLTYP